MDFNNHPLNNNVNINVSKSTSNNVNVKQVRLIADKLVRKLDDSHSYRFFCKVARQLPEHIIWANLEQAQTKDKPSAYFAATCSAQIKYGVQ